jgi:hypothetical protein
MNTRTTLPEPITAKELAWLLTRKVQWVRQQCAAGKIKVLPIGKPYLIPSNEVTRLLKPENHV